jgi:hypothetical protein
VTFWPWACYNYSEKQDIGNDARKPVLLAHVSDIVRGRIAMLHKKRSLHLESLESREVPALYGLPWYDPSRLTLGFASDGTPIAAHQSNLEQSLSGDWQRTLLTAFQNWAAHTNLNFAFQPDNGEAFGTPGLMQGDPRFADIRIGGHGMSPDVLAVAIPPDPTLAGTWSGDILFNTDVAFNGSPYSLLAVAMHEAGHSLGLDNSTDPNSVMYTLYNNTRTTLSAEDISRIQALYGVRTADSYEGTNNNNVRSRASAFRLPVGYTGETPMVAFGDITQNGDVDFFSFRFPPDGNDDQNQGEATIRLQTSGVSLLAPKVTVVDQAGRVMARVTSTSITGDTLQINLTGLSTSARYFVRVEGATNTVFGVGSYGLSVRLDTKSSISDSVIDQFLSGPYQNLAPDQVDAFFRASGDVLLNAEEGANETPSTASLLIVTSGTNNSRYEQIGSLGKKEDVDVYRVVVPAGRNVLTANVWTADQTGFQPEITVVNAAGNPVAATVLVNGNGTSTVQVNNVVAGQTYFLKVTTQGFNQDKGNYLVEAKFGTVAAPSL